MKIVIAGAGDMGFHLAKLLSSEQQDIILIDTNSEVLEYVETHLDVFTIKGDASSITTLQSADLGRADLFLAVTTSESSNIVSSILAKKMGAKQTVARVNNEEYFQPSQKSSFKELGVDKLFSPNRLAVAEIERLIQLCEATDNFEFENGKISLLGITLDDSSPFINKSIGEIDDEFPDVKFRPIAILRGHDTIIPRSKTKFYRNDHVYFISQKKDVPIIFKVIGKQLKKVKNVMILGGSKVANQTAKKLEKTYNVTIVDPTKAGCKRLTEVLDNSLIVKGDPSNIDILKEEGLAEMDAFIALTNNAETNIIASLVAEEEGVLKTIALVDNMVYTHISQNIGVDTLINTKLIAANNIFRFVRKGEIEAIASLHGVDAEIIEYVVTKNSVLTRKNLREIGFPAKALIGSVIRGEQSIIPDGNFTLEADDKVIVFAMPEAIGKVENLFLKK
jgi:trk system potassium uptake protein TrkA